MDVRPNQAHRSRRWRGERGAVSILAAVSLVFLIPGVALSVDIGKLTSNKRQLQTVVDFAALDAARFIPDPGADVEQAARDSAARNRFVWNAEGHIFVVEIGWVNPSDRTFVTPAPGGQDPNAVRVSGQRDVNYSFIPGTGQPEASAIAYVQMRADPPPPPPPVPPSTYQPPPESDIGIGSTLASFSSQDSFLNPILGDMLGTSIDLDVADYDGLADATLTFGALFAELGLEVGNPDEVMNTQVSVKDVIDASATILSRYGGSTNTTAATALGTFSGGVDPSLTFTFDDIAEFGVGGPGAAVDATFNVLGLVGAAAQVANGTNAATINIPVTLPGIASGTIDAAFIEAPVFAHGPAEFDAVAGGWVTQAHTAQSRLYVQVALTGTVQSAGLTIPISFPLYVEAGAGHASLTDISCEEIRTDTTITVDAKTDALAAHVGQIDLSTIGGTDPVTVGPATVGSVSGVLTVTAEGSMSALGVDETVAFGPGPYPREQRVGDTNVSLGDLKDDLSVSVAVAGGAPLITAATQLDIRTQTTALIRAALDELASGVLDPLNALPLGITTGGATVFNPMVDCYDVILI